MGLVLLFLAGAKWRRYILTTVAFSAAVFAVLVIHNPNRLRRFSAFLDVEHNKQGGTYQLYQSEEAFAAGGLEGAGLGQGRQQINFLPEAHTDFIFAVVGEELGLGFTLGVVAVFCVMLGAGLLHLRKAPNLFQFLLVTGCLLLMCLQAIINLGVVTGLLPTKGMSLPFISAGLSNLLLMGILVGIFINTQRTWGRSRPAGRPPRIKGRSWHEPLPSFLRRHRRASLARGFPCGRAPCPRARGHPSLDQAASRSTPAMSRNTPTCTSNACLAGGFR